MLGVPAPYDNRADDPDYCFDAITSAAGSHAYAASKRGGQGKSKKDRHTSALFGADPDAVPADATSGNGDHADRSGQTRIVPAKTKGHGFADVWKRGCFCWEYKRQGDSDLSAALDQLKKYRDSLDNPPLLIVCDVDAFEIHTNFTGYPTEVYRFALEDLANPSAEWRERHSISPLNLLRKAFDAAEASTFFKPKRTVNDVTEDLARKVADLADQIREQKDDQGRLPDPHDVAHFLMQVVFALFAEDAELLPKGLVEGLISGTAAKPDRFHSQMRALFEAMEKGKDFGTHEVAHFNGGLFKGVASQRFPKLAATQIGTLAIVAKADWSAVEPSILGTLFERALNPEKRAQIGAHYTSREDIMLIIEPVVMAPLRREWAEARERANALLVKRGKAKTPPTLKECQSAIERELKTYHDRLASVTILDPACGSGNFLYVAIQCLLDLERELLNFAALGKDHGGPGVTLKPRVSPTQLHGIELNEYAAELARISIWIGYLKWKRENWVMDGKRPILDTLDTIENRDAALDRSNLKKPAPAKWPKADFIIGNPPFLGSKLFRKWGMSDDYLADLFKAYDLPKTIDLCCYWFEQARKAIERHPKTRAGLLATQAIRGGDNRTVLERIQTSGGIFLAWPDRKWVLDGAAVQVSMVGFDNGTQTQRYRGMESLSGPELEPVKSINADLSVGTNTASSQRLKENAGIAFMGDTKGGAFDIDWRTAATMLAVPNPSGKPNTDVVFPWLNGLDVTRRTRAMWIVDFGCDREQSDAAAYEAPFAHVESLVLPERRANRREAYAKRWWIHVEPRPAMWRALGRVARYLATPTLTKHRLFAWQSRPSVPDHQLICFARQDDYFFGVLQGAIHEVWARMLGTQLREAESGFRYTPSSTFETFPLPWAPGEEPSDPKEPKSRAYLQWQAIASAAAELHSLRENWLNPPEWLIAVEKQVDVSYRAELAAVPAEVRPLIRRSAIMSEAAKDKRLKTRTLTNLYNERPAWLRLAHERLDRAVLAAYKAVDRKGDWDPEWAKAYEPFGAGEITVKETGKGADSPEVSAAKKAALAARANIDTRILANLLRLNQERSGKAKQAKLG